MCLLTPAIFWNQRKRTFQYYLFVFCINSWSNFKTFSVLTLVSNWIVMVRFVFELDSDWKLQKVYFFLLEENGSYLLSVALSPGFSNIYLVFVFSGKHRVWIENPVIFKRSKTHNIACIDQQRSVSFVTFYNNINSNLFLLLLSTN